MMAAWASRLETLLGDPTQPGPFSWAGAMARDESEDVAAEELAQLHRMGLHRLLVPEQHGGDLVALEQLYALSRVLARRDPALALSFAMKSWSQLLWMAGNPEQQRWTSDFLLDRDGYFCLGVSEEAHGADLLASDVRYGRSRSGGFVLGGGAKWPIGMAARAGAALVLARDRERSGPRSLSWFLVPGERGWPEGMGATPRLRTLGLRSAELAGLAFDGLELEASALVGPEGHGLELALRLFHITRALVPGLSMGAADTALRIATAFALRRRLNNRAAWDIPAVRRLLLDAYADLLAADAVMLSSVRGLHLAPEQASVLSLVTKVMVPALASRAIRAAAEVLGARHFLREGLADGIFQKMLRDQAAIPLFDGSTQVCLAALAAQLPALLGRTAPAEEALARAATCFDPAAGLPAFEPQRVELLARGENFVIQGLAPRSRRWQKSLDQLTARAAALDLRSVQATQAAQAYAELHAAACCLHLGEGDAARRLLPEPDLQPPEEERLAARLEASITGETALSILEYSHCARGLLA